MQLGHALPADETDAKRFGAETQRAVMAVQRDAGLAQMLRVQAGADWHSAAPLRALFARVARPLAAADTPGAWYRGRRLVSLDGTTIDLPDSPALEERFGRPGASRGASSFPQLRLLTPPEAMSTYTFNKHIIQHNFCPTCGIHPYGEGTDPKGNAMAAVNIRSLEGVDIYDIPVQHFDGRAM